MEIGGLEFEAVDLGEQGDVLVAQEPGYSVILWQRGAQYRAAVQPDTGEAAVGTGPSQLSAIRAAAGRYARDRGWLSGLAQTSPGAMIGLVAHFGLAPAGATGATPDRLSKAQRKALAVAVARAKVADRNGVDPGVSMDDAWTRAWAEQRRDTRIRQRKRAAQAAAKRRAK